MRMADAPDRHVAAGGRGARDSGEKRATRLAPLFRDLADTYRRGERAERVGYLVGAALFVSGLVHLGVLVATGGSWSGPVSWRKPMSFGLSFGLTLATIVWVLSQVPLRRDTRARLLTAFTAACALEVTVITVQAWRRLPSHFGVEGDGVGQALGIVAAVGAVSILVTMFVATYLTLRPNPEVAPSMRLALRVGFLTLLVALLLGAYMLARGMVLARGQGDVPGAFAFTAGLKYGHAATMHGVLILPALAWLLRFTDRPEHVRVTVVRTACLGYVALAGVVVVESLAGVGPVPLTAAPVAATALVAVGLLTLLGAGAVAVHALVTTGVGTASRADSGSEHEHGPAA